jgi:creatinine amidohydrolase
MKRVWWGDFRAPEFERLDPEQVIAVLPIAAIEQHGPHLPLSTDTSIMEGMLSTVIERLDPGSGIRILPVQAVGKSNEHLYAAGTLTLSASTLIEAWSELGAAVARAGLRKMVIVTSHGGNEEIMGIVARELRVRHDMLVVKTSWQRFGLPEGLFSERETRYGIHGGDVETSLMLHFRPDLVTMDKARDFVSATEGCEDEFALLRPQGTHAFAWIARDLNPAGVVGEAAKASAEKGRLTAIHQADGFLKLLADLRRARLSRLLGPASV